MQQQDNLVSGVANSVVTRARLHVRHRNVATTQCRSRHAAGGIAEAGQALSLCECEEAVGPPGGLSCTKDGWFISSFENQGTWVRQNT
jgi:hypothetical protein